MNKRRISIDKLRIRLPRSMRHDAHAIAGSIGNNIGRTIAGAADGISGNVQVDEIALGRVQDISAIGERAAGKLTQILKDRNRN